MRLGKSRQRVAGGADGLDPVETGNIRPPALGIVDLRDQADVRKTGTVAMTECAGVSMIEQFFESSEPLSDEVLHPFEAGLGAAACDLHHVCDDIEVADRVDIHGDRMRQRPDP